MTDLQKILRREASLDFSNLKASLFDVETNGLYWEATQLHSLVINDINTDEIISCANNEDYTPLEKGLEYLEESDVLIGHNITMFDIPVLKKLYPNIKFKDNVVVFDTLLMSRLMFPDITDKDMILVNKGGLPKNLVGKHSLEAWGYRLGENKGDFGKDSDWKEWTPEMQAYCEQDVQVSRMFFDKIHNMALEYSKNAVDIEHRFAEIISRQVISGFPFNLEAAKELAERLTAERDSFKEELVRKFPPKVEEEVFIPKVNNTTRGYVKGEPFIKRREIPFNPGSRQQIAERLIEQGWEPQEYTDKGTIKVDEVILEKLADQYPFAKDIARYMMLEKRLGQLANGKQALIKKVKADGRMHGEMITNGAVTGRCTHCVPTTSKILTREGWKTYIELKIGEEVLGYNLITQKQEWTTVRNKYFFENAPVGSIGNQRIKLWCTEDHNWVVVKRCRKGQANYGNPRFVKAKDFKRHDGILVNAPFSNDNYESEYKIPALKYGYDHLSEILKFSNSQMEAFMAGFLLADGHLAPSKAGTKSWGFTQAEGEILDTLQTLLYLISSNRISRNEKTKCKGENQRWAYHVLNNSLPHIRVGKEFEPWKFDHYEDVWCPETDLGTWVMMQKNGFITITGNSNPNISQTPACSAEFGEEFRALYGPPPGMVQIGCDASGLELRCLAHYTHYWDEGKYTKIVTEGDVHTANQEAAGLPTRNNAKTFIYGWLYGAGDEKIGSIVMPLGSSEEKKKRGNELKTKFLEAMPAIAQLKEAISHKVKTKGYLIGIDGRKLTIRSEHAALNTLLQSAGAIIMKVANCVFVYRMEEEGYIWGKDWIQMANIHDEYQLAVVPEIADRVSVIAVEAIKEAGVLLNFNCPLDGEAKVGMNWEQTH